MGMASRVRTEVKVWKRRELTPGFSKDITTVTLAMSSAGARRRVDLEMSRHGDSGVPGNEPPQASQKKSPQSSDKP